MHGIKTNVLTAGTRAITTIATGIIGLVCTADDAVDEIFPLDRPTLITDLRRVIGDAGTTGTLKPTLEAIADQVGPILIVVRVAEAEEDPENPGAQDTLVIGDQIDGVFTGLQALLAAEVQTGFRPRILAAPGLDTQDVTTELAVIATKLRAMAYARAIGEDIAAVALYRANFSARELMLIWPDFTGPFVGDAVARAVGLRALIDETQGWNKTLSNVPVAGVTGLSKDIYFDLQDDETDAGTLNAAQVTTLVRTNGFRFWGNRTCSSEPLFAFESAVRTSQVLQDSIAAGLLWAIDKPLTVGLVRDILETINADFRAKAAAGLIVGGSAWFDQALNSPTDLANGKLVIDYDFTPTAPMEGLQLNQRITAKYYADFANLLAAA
ncbi:phage tail sheath subtilisin-like domain-containing protein [Croceicoccus sp. BE223]|uniref:phage tail sheath subtilisin-like domain-containing protein n=1 Tax=Croceicoccus sp. BE223 TaxID=2817716 RepID=UPI0028617324|nr:phage tail sheath subtilisin-like domain-containing protein [Croceicoccus sp. BE223]MDR7101454.1 phage tail sheath protein FI [Croceicoccus sp. BE223]